MNTMWDKASVSKGAVLSHLNREPVCDKVVENIPNHSKRKISKLCTGEIQHSALDQAMGYACKENIGDPDVPLKYMANLKHGGAHKNKIVLEEVSVWEDIFHMHTEESSVCDSWSCNIERPSG